MLHIFEGMTPNPGYGVHVRTSEPIRTKGKQKRIKEKSKQIKEYATNIKENVHFRSV